MIVVQTNKQKKKILILELNYFKSTGRCFNILIYILHSRLFPHIINLRSRFQLHIF